MESRHGDILPRVIDFCFLRGKISSVLSVVRPLVKLTFSAEDIEQLYYERFHHPHPRVQRKMEALYLKSQGAYPEVRGVLLSGERLI